MIQKQKLISEDLERPASTSILIWFIKRLNNFTRNKQIESLIYVDLRFTEDMIVLYSSIPIHIALAN
jgi:hypothetical protein